MGQNYLLLVLGPSNCFKIVKMIMERNFQPVIIFSFSKKECEAYALQMSKLDFNSGENSINCYFGELCVVTIFHSTKHIHRNLAEVLYNLDWWNNTQEVCKLLICTFLGPVVQFNRDNTVHLINHYSAS